MSDYDEIGPHDDCHAVIASLGATVTALRKQRDDMIAAAKEATNDIDTYIEWARRNGRTNSELLRIGRALRAAIAAAEKEADRG